MDKYLNEKKEYNFVAFKLNGCWQKRSLGFKKEKKKFVGFVGVFLCVFVVFFVLIIKDKALKVSLKLMWWLLLHSSLQSALTDVLKHES